MNLFEARRKYKNLYMIKFPDNNHVIFRILTWSEFKAYRSLISIYGETLVPSAQEDLFEYCMIDMSYRYYEEDGNRFIEYETIPAGVIEVVSNLIYRISGADSSDQFFVDLENSRYGAQVDTENRILSTVSVLTKLSPEQYENMYWPDILKIISQNELLLMNDMPAAPFHPAAPEENAINFDKENRDDEEAGGVSANDIVEARRQRTRDLRKQMKIK